jgi:hypothetical protein
MVMEPVTFDRITVTFVACTLNPFGQFTVLESITVPATVTEQLPVYGVRVTPAGTPVFDGPGQSPDGAVVAVVAGVVDTGTVEDVAAEDDVGGAVLVVGATEVVGAGDPVTVTVAVFVAVTVFVFVAVTVTGGGSGHDSVTPSDVQDTGEVVPTAPATAPPRTPDTTTATPSVTQNRRPNITPRSASAQR